MEQPGADPSPRNRPAGLAMARFFNSISTKIFGISVALLVIMSATALWTTVLTQQVHRQLRTMSSVLFPITVRLAEVRTLALAEQMPINESGDACKARVAGEASTADRLLREAEALRLEGARIAVLERNRLEMARLQPMLKELHHQQRKLAALLPALCGAADARAQAANQAQAAEVMRLAEAISREMSEFVVAGAEIVTENQQAALRATLAMILAAGGVGLMLAWFVSRGLTRPIARLQAGAHAVGAGSLDTLVKVTSNDEIGDVTRTFNTMIAGLREKERVTKTFGQYVDPRVVAGLVGGETERSSTGEKQIATLFFSDIAGFTGIAERLAPGTLVNLINAYFSEMSAPIRARSGVIDKYIGDAIMAFWVPPFAEATTQAVDACAAALEQLRCLEAFSARIPDLIGMRRDIPSISIRIGIATGEVVVGSIGSETARSFTAMGDTVNFGARLEGANKAYGTRIMIDAATRDAAGSAIEVRELDWVGVVGRDQPVRIYELVGMAGDITPRERMLYDAYEAALDNYRTGNWTVARTLLEDLLVQSPNDGPALAMLARLGTAGTMAPADWRGISRLVAK